MNKSNKNSQKQLLRIRYFVLQAEFTKYYERFKMYYSNPTLNKAIGKIKNNTKNKVYLIRELVVKNFKEKDDLKSLENTIKDMKTNRAFEKYSTLSEKAGKGKLEKSEGNQINKKTLEKRKKEIKQLMKDFD